MSMPLRFLLIACVMIAACGSRGTEPFVPPSHVEPCKELRVVNKLYYGDPAFSPEEREKIVAAADGWREFTEGTVNIGVQFSVDDGPRIFKRVSTDSDVIEHEKKQPRKPEEAEFVSAGWTTWDKDVYVVSDRVPLERLQTLLAHEFGHVADMEWQNCDGSVYDCRHADDPASVMYAMVSSTSEFSPVDRLMCLASCLCR